MKTNVLYFGDNLEILRNRDYFPDSSIDLIYLDPPFNSKKDYNILFKENGGVESEAQIKAFTDTWHWTQTAENTYHEIVTKGPLKVGKLIGALHDSIGNNDVMAYLVMMTARLIELHRVLKPTGSLYLHCDPTASHYLKLVLDQIFGPVNFRNEIVWERYGSHNDPKRFGRVTDYILFYSKTQSYKFNPIKTQYSEKHLSTRFKYSDPDGRKFWPNTCLAPGGRGPRYEWKGHIANWRFTREKMEELDAKGEIYYSKSGIPYRKNYLDSLPGQLVQSVWTDIKMTRSGAERLGYETQKPLALLERIIKASSNEGDIVLDPFCGCGTAVVAAQKLNRRWIGIDITHLAVALMRNRLKDSFGIDAEVIGEPVDLAGAKALAYQDRYQFQWWALSLIKARPLGEKRKGADKGIDGVIHFIDDPTGAVRRVVVQVKSGHVGVNAVRELKAVAANDAIGVLLTLEPPTSPMKVEAVDAGYYHSPIYDKDYPKIQILTIEELLHGKTLDMPPQTQTNVTFAKAQRILQKEGEQYDTIASIRVDLEKAHVQGILEYIKKLQANSKSENFHDFLLEGRAALMFKKAGFDVTMRDSPDLALRFNNEQLYAEVKHFRMKEQDRIDAAKMSGPGDELVPYGDTFSSEGRHAWEQVYDVAVDKVSQYKEHAPNILVIESGSDCVDDLIISTAINMINEDVRSGKRPGLAKLNGILLILLDLFIISKGRKVFFYRTSNPAVSLSQELSDLLDKICLG